MKFNQKGSAVPVIVVVIALIVIGLLVYAYTRSGDTITDGMVSTSTTDQMNGTNGNGNGAGTNTGGNIGGTVNTTSWQTYTNAGYGFSLVHPASTQVRDVEITGGRNISFTFPQNVPGFDFRFPLLEVQVQNQVAGADGKMVNPACDNTRPNTLVTINGIRFIKYDSSADYAGTADSAVAMTYCAINNGTRYNLTVRTINGQDTRADKSILLPQFEEVLNSVKFRFVEKPQA